MITGFVDVVGFVAGTLTTIAFLPQVVHTVRTRSTGDLSLPMWIAFTAGVALWLAYGILLGAWPIIVPNAITVVLAMTVLALKIRHG